MLAAIILLDTKISKHNMHFSKISKKDHFCKKSKSPVHSCSWEHSYNHS